MSVGNPESKFDQVSKLQASLPSSNRCKGPLSVLVQIGDQKELNVSMRERERGKAEHKGERESTQPVRDGPTWPPGKQADLYKETQRRRRQDKTSRPETRLTDAACPKDHLWRQSRRRRRRRQASTARQESSPRLVGWRPSLLGASLVGWRPSLLAWRPLLLVATSKKKVVRELGNI